MLKALLYVIPYRLIHRCVQPFVATVAPSLEPATLSQVARSQPNENTASFSSNRSFIAAEPARS